MTEYKHGSNSSNYHKKLSTEKTRLKKSLSECESYEMEGGVVNFNLSPSKRRQQQEMLHRHHHCPRQSTTMDGGDISYIDIAKVQYNYDTSKSQYLLQQQQKLKEYKNDPNYIATNGDNYSSESSTETRGILKKSTTTTSSTATTTTSESNASNGNNNGSSKSSLLKRNKGLSTLSLCSCDADTEVGGKEKPRKV